MLRRDKRLPEPFEYLGWCSWAAFHREISAEGVAAKAAELAQSGTPVRWFLIEAGWMQTEGEKLLAFEEDREKFPDGLSGFISEVKRRHGLRWVGIWQNFTGFWHGIHREGVLARERSEMLYATPNGRLMPPPDATGSFAFWDAWNRYLQEQGVDFVKSDSHGTIAVFVQDHIPLARAARELHRGMEASTAARFDRAVINCTGMAHETTWTHPQAVVCRNSVDYNPAKPETMRAFIVQNAYNSFYYSQLFYTDWDMWWSRGPTAKLGAVLHALAGSIL